MIEIALIHDLLDQLAEVDGVALVVITGPDGLVVDYRGSAARAEVLAAHAAHLLATADRAGHEVGSETTQSIGITSESGVLFTRKLGGVAVAILLERPGNLRYVERLVESKMPLTATASPLRIG